MKFFETGGVEWGFGERFYSFKEKGGSEIFLLHPFGFDDFSGVVIEH